MDISIHQSKHIVDDQPHNGLPSDPFVLALDDAPGKSLEDFDLLLITDLLEVLDKEKVIGWNELVDGDEGGDVSLADVWGETCGMRDLVDRWLVEH